MTLPVASARETRAWVGAELRSRKPAVAGTVLAGLVAAAASVAPVYALGVLVDRVRAGPARPRSCRSPWWSRSPRWCPAWPAD